MRQGSLKNQRFFRAEFLLPHKISDFVGALPAAKTIIYNGKFGRIRASFIPDQRVEYNLLSSAKVSVLLNLVPSEEVTIPP